MEKTVELIVCWEHGTWETKLISVPEKLEGEELRKFAQSKFFETLDKYEVAVYVGIYNDNPLDVS